MSSENGTKISTLKKEMPKPNLDDDGFIKVDYKKKKKMNSCQKVKKGCISEKACDITVSYEAFYSKFSHIKMEMLSSNFFSRFESLLFHTLQICNKGEKELMWMPCTDLISNSCPVPPNCLGCGCDIVCYGLGKFLSCVNAQYQLAFLVILSSKLSNHNVYVYDPMFSSDEVNILKELKFCVLESNEEGKRTAVKTTVFYMPHCGKPLYNSMLWANWSVDKLSNVILIGNSINNMVENIPKRKLSASTNYLYTANTFVEEFPIRNIFKYTDIFNNMSIHMFQTSKLAALPITLWLNAEEPHYTSDDEIILSKLNLLAL